MTCWMQVLAAARLAGLGNAHVSNLTLPEWVASWRSTGADSNAVTPGPFVPPSWTAQLLMTASACAFALATSALTVGLALADGTELATVPEWHPASAVITASIRSGAAVRAVLIICFSVSALRLTTCLRDESTGTSARRLAAARSAVKVPFR
jgi:hypothetical protein